MKGMFFSNLQGQNIGLLSLPVSFCLNKCLIMLLGNSGSTYANHYLSVCGVVF